MYNAFVFLNGNVQKHFIKIRFKSMKSTSIRIETIFVSCYVC